jgi:hypothetical protein
MEVKMNILGKYGDGNVKLRQSVNMISQYTVYQPLISFPHSSLLPAKEIFIFIGMYPCCILFIYCM